MASLELDQYLAELADPCSSFMVSGLARLSGLEREGIAQLHRVWSTIPVERRRRLLRDAAELAEDNVGLNFDALFLEALGDEDAEVRLLAIRGLWEYERRDLIPRLVEHLSDVDLGVCATAALALGRFVVLGELQRLPAADLERAVDALRSVIAEPQRPVEVRARAIEAVGASSQPFVQAVIEEAYGSGNRRLRLAALHAMGRSCDARWLPLVLDHFSSDEAELRYEAAMAAGSIADRQAVGPLAELLDDEDAEVQAVAIEALGHIGGRVAKSCLKPYLKHPAERVRELVHTALTELEFDEDPLSVEYRLER